MTAKALRLLTCSCDQLSQRTLGERATGCCAAGPAVHG